MVTHANDRAHNGLDTALYKAATPTGREYAPITAGVKPYITDKATMAVTAHMIVTKTFKK